MTGRTNYTAPSNGFGFAPPKDMEDIYKHFDPLIGEEVDLASSLPPADQSWPGREVYVGADTDPINNGLYIRNSDNTAWLLVAAPEVSATIATFGTNWTPIAGFTPTVRRDVNRIFLEGAVTLGASGGGGGYTNILTVPVGFRPPGSSNRFVGCAVSSQGAAAQFVITPAGVLQNASGYATASLAFGVNLPLNFSWPLR